MDPEDLLLLSLTRERGRIVPQNQDIGLALKLYPYLTAAERYRVAQTAAVVRETLEAAMTTFAAMVGGDEVVAAVVRRLTDDEAGRMTGGLGK